MTANTTIESLTEDLAAFAEERDWDQFHSPKNLAMALSVEASELLEIFQWLTPDESQALTDKQLLKIKEEVADIFIYLMRFCDKTGINMLEAARHKIEINRAKYPAHRVRGKADKYTEYQQ